MAKLFIPSVIILACAFGSFVNAHELHASSSPNSATLDYDLGADGARYALAEPEVQAEPEVKQQGWYEWAKSNAQFAYTFGINAGSWLLSGIYGLVKDGILAMGTKYVADYLSITAAALLAVYFDLGALSVPVTKFFLDGLARKVVGIVRNKMAEKGAELSSVAVERLQSIAYNVLAAKMPIGSK